MKKEIYIILISVLFIYCNSNKKKEIDKELLIVDSIQNSINKIPETETAIEQHNIEIKQSNSPIHGELTQANLDKYYPKITDTIKELRIIGSQKTDLNPGNDIIVSLLQNTGTFNQMILCTHNKNLDLIDHLYIGKATDFDNGKSHTIDYSTLNNNEIIFNQIDWGYVTKDKEEEIDTVSYEKWNISIAKNGQIKLKK